MWSFKEAKPKMPAHRKLKKLFGDNVNNGLYMIIA